MGYLVSNGALPPDYDLRSKNVNWLPASFRESAPGIGEAAEMEIAIAPNPFSDRISLSVTHYNGSSIDLRMTDILGRILLEIKGEDLTTVNARLAATGTTLNPGNYFITVRTEDITTSHKVIKL